MSTPDLSEFEALGRRNQKRPCQIAAAFEQLDEQPKAELVGALAADKTRINAAAIEKWLARREITVSIPAITTHRQGKCRCADGG